jgi:hypothetical protein
MFLFSKACWVVVRTTQPPSVTLAAIIPRLKQLGGKLITQMQLEPRLRTNEAVTSLPHVLSEWYFIQQRTEKHENIWFFLGFCFNKTLPTP